MRWKDSFRTRCWWVISNGIREVVCEHSLVAKIAELYAAYTSTCEQIRDSQELIRTEQDDPDLVEMAKAELEELALKQSRTGKGHPSPASS